ncbi:AAA family ATPase [Corallococcus sp. 4LFB]|uniref:AAA family ATPase n=1 Tax=Corallococcus sp. 4LFB TaxID=3383249 RepID=UPI003976BEE5
MADGSLPELTFEERGKSVLSLKELSSGEQQLVRLCAVTTLSAGAILAIQEPELSLDVSNQNLLREILRSQVHEGLQDQIIIESHVPTFDGPSVVQFSRTPSGQTQVTRAPSTNASHRALAQEAKAMGAEERWVTRDGYTRIPELMRQDLQLTGGGQLWFLKGRRAWETWREEDLATLLADPETDKHHG